MTHANLVLFEAHRICSEAVIFAREYCIRMEHSAALLMLVPMTAVAPSGGRRTLQETEAKAATLLKGVASTLTADDIRVTLAVRIGPPEVELIKYLAEAPPFNIIIWGSDKALPHHTPFGKHHWMADAAGNLGCPLYSVATRPDPKQEHP